MPTTLQQFEYFYDRQQLRFLEQVIRAFSGFQYMSGSVAGQPPQLITVPCRMASTNQLVASIIKNNSANTLNTVPLITVWQTGLTLRNEDLQSRNHVDTRQVVERAIDPETGKYTGERGQSYTVQRLMPIPFNMEIQIDLWTSNLGQKYQLEEQLLTITIPNFDIQNSDNALDWTALTTMYCEGIEHSSRTIPVGSDTDQIDIMTTRWRLPIWLSPPAKVKQQTLVHEIVTNFNEHAAPADTTVIDEDAVMGVRYMQSIVTPGNHYVTIEDGVITLLGAGGRTEDDQGNPYNWRPLIDQYGFMRPAVSTVSIATTGDIEGPTIVGTVQYNTNDPTQLLWTIDPDTLPANTLAPVNAVIEPLRTYPGNGLSVAAEGDRYLVLQDIGPSSAWPGLTAKTNDIIQYHSGAWQVVFNAAITTDTQYVLNVNKNRQLRWSGGTWVLAIDGTYPQGYWMIKL